MSLTTKLTDCLTVIGDNVKTLYANDGNLGVLTTTTKSNLVDAINEINLLVGAVPNQLATLRADILGGADAAFDTLKELQDLLTNDTSQITALLTAVGNRVLFDEDQDLNAAQKLRACKNIGIGDYNHDFTADYITARGPI
jgi:hypothetical protein